MKSSRSFYVALITALLSAGFGARTLAAADVQVRTGPIQIGCSPFGILYEGDMRANNYCVKTGGA